MNFVFPEHLRLANTPTPVESLKRLPWLPKGKRLWIKRDDFTGSELSGNKVRKLEFLFREALDIKADHILTCGGLQSNHCRAAALIAARLGLECTLFLRGKAETDITGNYFLDLLAGAYVEYVTPQEYESIDTIMQSYADTLNKKGQIPYIIPEGGSNATGVWGYIKCFAEIFAMVREKKLPVETIAVATGSGGTHAGLLIGSKLLNSDIQIISINVCDDAGYFRERIKQIILAFNRKYEHDIPVKKQDIEVLDGFTGSGYAQADDRVTAIITEMSRCEGIILDPVYSAKAFLGVRSLMQNAPADSGDVLFIHTGGHFGIFPMVEAFDL